MRPTIGVWSLLAVNDHQYTIRGMIRTLAERRYQSIEYGNGDDSLVWTDENNIPHQVMPQHADAPHAMRFNDDKCHVCGLAFNHQKNQIEPDNN